MITKEYKEEIRTVLGKHYSAIIINHLTKKEIYNSNGCVYLPHSIQKIVLGMQSNFIVETEIVKLVDKVRKQKEKLQESFSVK